VADRQELPPIEFVSIGEDTNCAGLKCTNTEINRWFEKSALKEHLSGSLRVICAVEQGISHRPLGFYAIASVAEETANLPGLYHRFRKAEHFSALQLVWLATDKGFVDRGLGALMVGEVTRMFASVGPLVAMPHLIVIPHKQDHERLVKFYGDLGFKRYKDGEAMFLSVQAAVDGEAKIQAALAAMRAPEL